MFMAMPNAAILASNPTINPRLPKNSAQMARNAKIAGICIWEVKKFMVPENPKPPNQPSIFCAPCRKKRTPRMSRISVSVVSLTVANSFLMKALLLDQVVGAHASGTLTLSLCPLARCKQDEKGRTLFDGNRCQPRLGRIGSHPGRFGYQHPLVRRG